MPLPNLSWELHEANVSSPYESHEILTALKTLINNDSTYWDVVSSNDGGGTTNGDTDALLIRPLAAPLYDAGNSGGDSFHILIAGSDNAYPSNDGENEFALGYRDNAEGNNRLYLGIFPDGINDVSPGNVTGNWNSDDPQGGGNMRWSKYMPALASATDTLTFSKVYIVESSEILSIWIEDLTNNKTIGWICGAILTPPADADGEPGSNRIFGIANTGNTEIPINFWEGYDFLKSSGGYDVAHVGIFNPAVPSDFVNCSRHQSSIIVNRDTQRLTTQQGTRVHLPVTYFAKEAAESNVFFGTLRQMRVGEPSTSLTEITSDGTHVSWYVGHSRLLIGDTLAYDDVI